MIFNSLSAYEEHYRVRHCNRCSHCRAVLTTPHLLRLHSLEEHDTLFQIMASKRPMVRGSTCGGGGD